MLELYLQTGVGNGKKKCRVCKRVIEKGHPALIFGFKQVSAQGYVHYACIPKEKEKP
jgi:hypothetical protein